MFVSLEFTFYSISHRILEDFPSSLRRRNPLTESGRAGFQTSRLLQPAMASTVLAFRSFGQSCLKRAFEHKSEPLILPLTAKGKANHIRLTLMMPESFWSSYPATSFIFLFSRLN